jgi:hypothetical protein
MKRVLLLAADPLPPGRRKMNLHFSTAIAIIGSTLWIVVPYSVF